MFFAAFFYEFFSNGQKIFFSDGKNSSIVRQLGEIIFSPAEKLKGEDNDRINILLLGIGGEKHYGGELTDTIMIASVNTKTNEAALLSIPRDLYVQVPGTNINNKINAIKSYGNQGEEKNGMKLLKEVVEEISGLEIHYYTQLDFDGFIKIIDSLGGIDVYIEKDINDPNYPNFNRGYDPFYIEKGWHHLDGATTLKVARSRHSTMGDFDRIKRQQDIIKATKQKVFQKYSRFDVIAFKNIFVSLSSNLKTDLQLKELPRFYEISKKIKSYDINVETVDTKNYLNRTYLGRGYTLQVKENDYQKINELSANIFDLEISDERKKLIKDESANIEIQNGTGTLDLANQVASDLEELGYRIINSTNIDLPEFSGVQIYDNSENLKPATLDFLKEKFNGVIMEVSEDEFSKADFVIVLGKGF